MSLLSDQIVNYEAVNDRRNFRDHIRGCGTVLLPDKRSLVLIHHNAYNRLQQPASHWDATELDPLQAARREVLEESAVCLAANLSIDLTNVSIPLMIDSHQVLARPNNLSQPKCTMTFAMSF